MHREQERASPKHFVGGLSLDLLRLKAELLQDGCPEEMAAKALRDVEYGGSATVYF